MLLEAIGRGLVIVLFAVATSMVHAEQGVMTVVVHTPTHEPIANVRIGVAGDGSIESTDLAGRARLRLAPQTRVGTRVKLQLLPPPSMVFLSPYEGDAIVPSYDNESGNYLAVILLATGDKTVLANGVVLSEMIRQSQRQLNARPKPSPPRPRKTSFVPRAVVTAGAPLPSGGLQLIAEAPGTSASPPPLVGRPEELPLITEDVGKRLGFSKEDIDAALGKWSMDLLTWKMIMVTSVFEVGTRDPFSISIVDPYQGIKFGLGFWSLNRRLPEVLKRFRELDRTKFDTVMGADAEFVAQWLDNPKEQTRGVKMIEEVLRGKDLKAPVGVVPEPWKTRFAQLGGHVPFQQVQVELMKPFIKSGLSRAQVAGLRSERAQAFFYDLTYNTGPSRVDRLLKNYPDDLKAFEAQIHRPPDEQEALLLLTNRWMQSMSPAAAPFARLVRERRLTLALGEGTVSGRRVSLEEAGIRMRDFETGAALPLSGDRAVLERLIAGWAP